MSSQYFKGKASQLTSKSCTIDTSTPTFAGVSSVTPQVDGSFVLNWAAASGTKTPIRYELYVALGSLTAAALFVTANRIAIAPSALTSWRVFVLRDQLTYFQPGQLYTFGVRAVDSQNYVDTNVVILNSTALYPNYGSLAAAVWDQLKTAHTVAGSFGDYLDAKVSLTQLASVALTQYNALTTALGTLQTSAVALTQFGTLQTAIRLVQTAATALSQYNSLVSDIGSPQQASTAATQYSNIQTAIAAVQQASTALSQFNTLVSDIAAIVPPDNSDILAIKAKTDNLPSQPASEPNVTAVGNAVAVVGSLVSAIKTVTDKFLFDGANFVKSNAQVVSDKTGYDLLTATVTTIAAKVWDQLVADHQITGSFGANAQTPVINPSQVAAAVWNALIADYDVSGSFGANAQTPAINPTQVAQAVWNALITDYDLAGSFGNTLQNPAISPTQVATAVWNALLADYNIPNTMGAGQNTASMGGGSSSGGGALDFDAINPEFGNFDVVDPNIADFDIVTD